MAPPDPSTLSNVSRDYHDFWNHVITHITSQSNDVNNEGIYNIMVKCIVQ